MEKALDALKTKTMKKQTLILLLLLGVGNLSAQIVLPAYHGTHYNDGITDCGTVTDYDGNVYQTVVIGEQCWMAENLKYLPSVVGPGTGSNTTPYYYVYGYNGTDVTAAKATANYDTYGVLYNLAAALAGESSSGANASGVQGICPDGWHLPSDAEWTELTEYLGGEYDAGGKLKETGTAHWNSPNTEATNETGFTALPGGVSNPFFNTFQNIGNYWYAWSSTEFSNNNYCCVALHYHTSNIDLYNTSKGLGLSVRCVKD